MSSEALFRVSETIRSALQTAVNPTGGPGARVEVQLKPPSAVAQGASVLSWWLYQVTEDEFARNGVPSARVNDKRTEQALPSLRVNLHYLLTPVCGTVEEDQRVLGLAMRWLYENAVLQVRSAADGVNDILRVSIDLTDLEGLARIWESLRQDYRLSVGYLVRSARIDPTRVSSVSPVVASESNLGDLVNIPREPVP